MICDKYQLPLLNHYDSSHSPNPGFFRGLMEFAGTLD
jgi:hypothetical protein